MFSRRLLLLLAASNFGSSGATCRGVEISTPDLLTAPLDLIGDWGGSLPQAARQVILKARAACLGDVRRLSDRQPARLRVEDHTTGPPAVWLHDKPADAAWVIVDIGPRDWSKLAYQFGHELGHVFANSWGPDAHPKPPCQWLEEALVEAFSIRGLGRLAADWAKSPPFPGDNAFASALQRYRDDLVARYAAAAPATGLAAWLRGARADVERNGGVSERLGPAILWLLDAFRADSKCVEDLGALNRWPERTGLRIHTPWAVFAGVWVS